MNNILKEKFPFTFNFFEKAISNGKLFHSYILTGNNNVAKYAFAIDLAKKLNCTGDKTDNCQCLNCKWISNNSHPAVMTFSPIDFVHVNNGGQAKENITVNQARFIKDELSKTSTYHRILIITDAIEGKEAQKDYEELKKYNIMPPLEAGEENNSQRIWAPKSLKQDIFSTETANALLKTIEEPFDKVTFVFLANSTEDIIPTIVSRCQCVNVPSCVNYDNDYSMLKKIIENYPAKDNLTSIMMAEHIKNLSKDYDMPVVNILSYLEDFYRDNLKNYLQSAKKYRNILTLLNKLEIAKSQLNQYVNQDSVLENLFFN